MDKEIVENHSLVAVGVVVAAFFTVYAVNRVREYRFVVTENEEEKSENSEAEGEENEDLDVNEQEEQVAATQSNTTYAYIKSKELPPEARERDTAANNPSFRSSELERLKSSMKELQKSMVKLEEESNQVPLLQQQVTSLQSNLEKPKAVNKHSKWSWISKAKIRPCGM